MINLQCKHVRVMEGIAAGAEKCEKKYQKDFFSALHAFHGG